MKDAEDLAAMGEELRRLEGLSDRFAAAFTGAMSRAVRSGRSFEDTLADIALSMSRVALQAGLKPLERAVSGALTQLAGSVTSTLLGGGGGGFGGASARMAAPAMPAVNVSIQAADPAAFEKSQAQVAATLATAVGRARRTL